MFGQKVNGMGFVRRSWKNLKVEVFIGHLEKLKVGVDLGCWINLDMLYGKGVQGF